MWITFGLIVVVVGCNSGVDEPGSGQECINNTILVM